MRYELQPMGPNQKKPTQLADESVVFGPDSSSADRPKSLQELDATLAVFYSARE